MSELESDVKPVLAPLIRGEATNLDQAQQETLARWITLKVLVSEHNRPENAVTPRVDRMAFRQSGAIPPYMCIYLASHSIPFEKAIGFRRNSHVIAIGSKRPSPPLLDAPNNIQTVSFFLGCVFVHVTSSRVDDFAIEHIARIHKLYETCRIWPNQRRLMAWPRDPSFSLDEVNAIGESMISAIHAQNPIWLQARPRG